MSLVGRAQPTQAANTEKPNIVFIFADDLDFDQFNLSVYPLEKFPSFTGAHITGNLPDHYLPEGWEPFYFEKGDIYTPNLEKLSKQGAHLSRFYIHSPMCTPSRYSLLTGKYAFRSPTIQEKYPSSEVMNVGWDQYLDASQDNFVRHLKKAGYTTAITGKWHNGEPDEISTPKINRKYQSDPELLQKKLQNAQVIGSQYLKDVVGFDIVKNMSFDNADNFGGHNLPWHTEAVLEFLDREHTKPFFLYFPLPVPHGFGGPAKFSKDLTYSPEGRLEAIPDTQPSIEDVFRRIREKGASDRSITFTWIDDMVGVNMQ